MRLAHGGETVTIQQHQIDLLVHTLRARGSRAADAIAEELAALSLAGVQIDLLPSPAELKALIDALVQINTSAKWPDATFGRVLGAARAQERA